MMFLTKSLVSTALFVGFASAKAICRCKNLGNLIKCNAALTEAITVAGTAIGALANPTDEVVQGALGAIFKAEDVSRAITAFGRLNGIASDSTLSVTIFCEEDHVSYEARKSGWVDNAFTYLDKDGDKQLTSIFMEADTNTVNKPGSFASYTVCGTSRGLSDGTTVDCTDQAHIVLGRPHLSPGPADFFDFRPLTQIRSEGIDPNHNSLDYIKSLSYVIIHEMMHVIGGYIDPTSTSPRYVINDGADNRDYGYAKCTAVNQNRNNNDIMPYLRADCLAILAKALYLDKANNIAQYWSTGAVGTDGKALIDKPAGSTTSRVRRALAAQKFW